MYFLYKVFLLIFLLLLFALHVVSTTKKSGGSMIGRPATIISINGNIGRGGIPLPETIVMQYPREELPIILKVEQGGLTKSGSFGTVVEYSGYDRSYMVKILKNKYWVIEKKWWHRLTPRLKGLFTETYFGSPDMWHKEEDNHDRSNTTISFISTMEPPSTPDNMSIIEYQRSAPNDIELSKTLPTLGGGNDYGIIIMEKYMGTLMDLAKERPVRYNDRQVKSIMRQIINSLILLKDNNILYTDLKLDNCVYEVNSYGQIVVKLIDIGSLCDAKNCQIGNIMHDRKYGAPGNHSGVCPHTYMFKSDINATCEDYLINICRLMLYQFITKDNPVNLDVNTYRDRLSILEEFGHFESIIKMDISSLDQFKLLLT